MLTQTDLSFINPKPKKGTGLNHWSVNPPDNYTDAWNYGEDLALELMEWFKNGGDTDLSFILNSIAEDQQSDRSCRNSRYGAILGFWRGISWFAADAVQFVNFPRAREKISARREQAAAQERAARASLKQEASERARHAAQVRWGKKAA